MRIYLRTCLPLLPGVCLLCLPTPAVSLSSPQESLTCYSALHGSQTDEGRQGIQAVFREVVQYAEASPDLELCESNVVRWLRWEPEPGHNQIIYEPGFFVGLLAAERDRPDVSFYALSYGLANVNLGHGGGEPADDQVLHQFLDADDAAGYIVGKSGRRVDGAESFMRLTFAHDQGPHRPNMAQHIAVFERGWARGHADATLSDRMSRYYRFPTWIFANLFSSVQSFFAYIASLSAGVVALYGALRWIRKNRRRRRPRAAELQMDVVADEHS